MKGKHIKYIVNILKDLNLTNCFILIVLFYFFAGNIYAQKKTEFILSSINFNGNAVFSDTKLGNVIISKESPSWFSQFIHSFSPLGAGAMEFDSTLIKTDIRSLENYYKVNGYFDVKVKANYTVDPSGKDVELNYLITEGKPYYFKKVTKRGLKHISNDFLTAISDASNIDSTQVFTEKKILNDLSFTTKYFQDRGYMFFKSERPDIYVDTLLKKVRVKEKFNTGKPFKISDVFVDKKGFGKSDIATDLIRDIVDIKKGDLFSNEELNLSQIRLYRTNLFSSAFVSPIFADTGNSTVPIQVSTTIGRMNELVPEVIINNEDNAFNLGLSLGYSRKNFLGDARKLTLQTSVAAQNILDFISHPSLADSNIFGYADARLILEQPFLFGKLIQTRFETYLTLQKRRADYSTTIYGGKISLNFELPRNTYLTEFAPFITFEHSNTILRDTYLFRLAKTQLSNTPGLPNNFNVDSAATVFVNNISSENKNQIVNTSLIGINLEANKTNNLFFPTKGYKLSFLVANGNLLSRLFTGISKDSAASPLYYNLLFTGVVFPHIYNSKVSAFGIKLKFGFMHAYAGNKNNISITQRFNAGGSNSIRGWGSRDLGITSGTIPENLTIVELEQLFLQRATPGGFLILEGSFETRNRIAGKFGTAFFIDYGNVWNDFNDIQWNNIAVAAGFGLRYYSSFAPIRLDFGFRIYDPNDRRPITQKKLFKDGTFQIHIGIGEAF